MYRLALLAFASLFAFTACTENGLTDLVDEGVLGRIEVTPPVIQFGTLQDGEEDIRPYLITNIGNASLLIEDMVLEGSGSFVLLDERDNFLLAPSVTEQFDVLFSPLGVNDQLAHVTVYSDDVLAPEQRVDLIGYGAGPELQIDPPAYDFGAEFVGCGGEVEVFLRNIGDDDLIITAIDYLETVGLLTMDDANVLPLTLEPSQETSVWIDFEALDQVAVTGQLDVTSNDPRGVVSATQTGEGVFATTAEDTFVVPEDPPVDILFAVDQSGSMDWHASQLATAFSALIDAIGQVTSGWRIGVVTTDGGCFNSGVLTTSTPNLQSTFASAVSLNGTTFNYTEKLFQLTQIAMSKTYAGQCNANFLRPNALLHIVLVSDEKEQSGITPASFVSTMQSYKSSPSLVKVSGIICGPSGCGHADGWDTGYKDAVTLTNGVRLDVMATNWANNAQQLAAASLTSINRFELTQTAHPGSIRVWVDGTEWTTGWHYDAATNEVVFDTNPPPGGVVEVDYGVLVPC
ncbi:MAG: VWA domain-containing protein [Deltaproteobacteria bacterium]|nr:VWA domain-containing protein [Deltaproteobacteria bacterium]